MIATRLTLRDFRTYAAAEVELGPGLTVVTGRNGAGKTNLLEALYFACTGPLVPHGERARVRALRRAAHAAGAPLRGRAGRARAERRLPARRAEAPARGRRARRAADRRHARARSSPSSSPTGSSWSRARRRCAARTSTRSSPRSGPRARRPAAPTRAALAQRNALVAAIRAGRAGRGTLPAWDAELARHGIALMARPRRRRRPAAAALRRARRGPRACPRSPTSSTGPRSKAATEEELAAELAERARVRPRARLHRPRAAPRRPRPAPRRPRAARLRLPRPAAARAARAAARRARGARGVPRHAAADAARRRDVRARRRPARPAGRRPARRAGRA